MSSYKGTIIKTVEEKDIKPDFMPLLVWIIGVFVSLFPLFTDVIVFLSKERSLTKDFWISICLRGDILCILATMLVLSAMESFTKKANERKSRTEIVLTLLAMGLCCFLFASWTLFKYVFPESYDGNLPIILVVIFSVVSLVISSTLQIKLTEDKING